jgi:putative transposase
MTIVLSEKQHQVLEQIVRRTTNPYRLVRRAQLILATADGMSNSQISQDWELDRAQVRVWRQRWVDASTRLASGLSIFNLWVKTLKPDSGIRSGKLPID